MIVEFLGEIKEYSTFLTVSNVELIYDMKTTEELKYFNHIDEGKRRAQLRKRGTVIGGCFRTCKPSKCVSAL